MAAIDIFNADTSTFLANQSYRWISIEESWADRYLLQREYLALVIQKQVSPGIAVNGRLARITDRNLGTKVTALIVFGDARAKERAPTISLAEDRLKAQVLF